MAEELELEVATPEREFVREPVSEVQVPAKDGYLGILPGHAALLGQLGAGALSYTAGGRRHFLAVDGGFVEVLPDSVRVLADMAERASDINLDKARAELEYALKQLGDPSSGIEPEVALATMRRAQARVAAAERK